MKRKSQPGQATEAMSFGDVCQGWTREDWIVELRRKADRCEAMHAATAEMYRRWAKQLEESGNEQNH